MPKRSCCNCELKTKVFKKGNYCYVFELKPEYELPCCGYIPTDKQLKKENK